MSVARTIHHSARATALSRPTLSIPSFRYLHRNATASTSTLRPSVSALTASLSPASPGVRHKSSEAAPKPWGPPLVSYAELKPLTEQPTDDILLIDVREPDEVAQGTIPSSVSLPLSLLKSHLSSTFPPSHFVKQHMFYKPSPSQKIIFYCRTGRRSATACQWAQEVGFRNVRNYYGGWVEWWRRQREEGRRGFGGGDGDDD